MCQYPSGDLCQGRDQTIPCLGIGWHPKIVARVSPGQKGLDSPQNPAVLSHGLAAVQEVYGNGLNADVLPGVVGTGL